MTEREAFLARIKQHPKDNTVRMVYADWLEDSENWTSDFDTATAEFIRLTCDGNPQERKNEIRLWLRDNWERLIPKTAALHQTDLSIVVSPQSLEQTAPMNGAVCSSEIGREDTESDADRLFIATADVTQNLGDERIKFGLRPQPKPIFNKIEGGSWVHCRIGLRPEGSPYGKIYVCPHAISIHSRILHQGRDAFNFCG